MKASLAAAAIAGLALPALAGTSIFDVAGRYEGTWVDPNFTDGNGSPTSGAIAFESSFSDPDRHGWGDETWHFSVTTSGAPAGTDIPEVAVSLAVNEQGLVDVSNVPVPELDADFLYGTQGNDFPTPMLSVLFEEDGSLTIEILGALGFERVLVYGTANADRISLTADVYDFGGFPLSLGSTIDAYSVPAPSALIGLVLVGGVFTRRR